MINPDKMSALLSKYGIYAIGMLGGGILGFLYWNHIGCESGHCVIQSSPYLSTTYGLLVGGWISGFAYETAKKII